MKYYIIAGEASGDLHGSNLMKGLLRNDPEAIIRFWGGAGMSRVWDEMGNAADGVAPGSQGGLVVDYRDNAVMGFTDILKRIPQIARNLDFCKKDILAFGPDVVILIDYPGFNMKISRFCHEHGVKNFYYIAPKTWASRGYRNKALKKYVDRLFIVFPFEKPFFDAAGIPYTYCGNPLLDAVNEHEYTRVTPHPYIAILAGSRSGEISRMMPVCMQVVDRLSAMPQYRNFEFVVAGAPSRREEDYTKFIADRKNVRLVFSRTYDVLRFAESAIVNSGTASLECALMCTAQVVCWSTTPFTFFVAKNVLRVGDHIKYISLANLILDKLIFKEFIQNDFNVENVVAETRKLNEDMRYRSDMISDYVRLRGILGGTGASDKVAQEMISGLK